MIGTADTISHRACRQAVVLVNKSLVLWQNCTLRAVCIMLLQQPAVASYNQTTLNHILSNSHFSEAFRLSHSGYGTT
jgi:hypothetical protein